MDMPDFVHYKTNGIKQHMGNLPGYRFSGMLLSKTLRIVNSEYKYIEWIASARIIHLRSPKNFLPRNGRQVWLCLTFS